MGNWFTEFLVATGIVEVPPSGAVTHRHERGPTVKIVIETGSESHTTSSARLQASFVGGAYNGQYLYQQAQFQVKAEWDKSNDKHSKWVTTEYDLPAGTQFVVIGRGATGARGANKHLFQRVYRVEETADVLEEQIDVGLRTCLLKGRLMLVRDIAAEAERAKTVETDKGF